MSDEQRDRFDVAMASSKRLAKAWHYKEALQDFYQLYSQDEAESFLKRWYHCVIRTRFKHLKKAAKTIKAHWEGVLNYFKHFINTKITNKFSHVQRSGRRIT